MAPTKDVTIDERTRVSLGLILAIISLFGAGILAATAWVAVTVTRIDGRMASLEAANREAWTVGDQRLWSERVGRANPALTLPRVEEIRKP